MTSKTDSNRRMVLAALFLATALVLPFVTGYIPYVGRALSPMHLPVLLCGFFCGPFYALAIGIVAPLLRFFLFGMPPLMPSGLAMSFELATYGFASGMLYKLLPKKKGYIYLALIGAMVIGRIVWGIVSAVLYGITNAEFGWETFVTGSIVGALPGIIIQIVIIPILVITLEKYTYKGK